MEQRATVEEGAVKMVLMLTLLVIDQEGRRLWQDTVSPECGLSLLLELILELQQDPTH